MGFDAMCKAKGKTNTCDYYFLSRVRWKEGGSKHGVRKRSDNINKAKGEQMHRLVSEKL